MRRLLPWKVTTFHREKYEWSVNWLVCVYAVWERERERRIYVTKRRLTVGIMLPSTPFWGAITSYSSPILSQSAILFIYAWKLKISLSLLSLAADLLFLLLFFSFSKVYARELSQPCWDVLFAITSHVAKPKSTLTSIRRASSSAQPEFTSSTRTTRSAAAFEWGETFNFHFQDTKESASISHKIIGNQETFFKSRIEKSSTKTSEFHFYFTFYF